MEEIFVRLEGPMDSKNADEVAQLRQRVAFLEEELAKSRRALMKEYYARQPLPYSEEELKQIAAEEKGAALEDFITELENVAKGN
jgi:hypothetical protein